MFGLGFGEIVLLVVVAIVVVGPRQLPEMMRTAGQWVSRLRRMSTDLRAQSGIDQLMRDEGIDRSLQEIRSISNINVLDGLERMAQPPVVPPNRSPRPGSGPGIKPLLESKSDIVPLVTSLGKPLIELPTQDKPPASALDELSGKVAREREYPLLGCDAYGALPDDAAPYRAVATSDPMTSSVKIDPGTGGTALI